MPDADPQVREGTAAGLGKCGAEALPDLLEMLSDADKNVRYQVVFSLGSILKRKPFLPSIEAVIPFLIDTLVSALEDEYDQVMYCAAEALETLCDPRSIPGLIDALDKPETSVNYLSVNYLSKALLAQGQAALPLLREALKSHSGRIRSAAVKLVADFDDPADAYRLAEMMRDDDADVRLDTIRAIEYKQKGSDVILQGLIERLHDPEKDVGAAAIHALGIIRNPNSIPPLIQCLQLEASASLAARVLEDFNVPEARAAVRSWRKTIKL